MESLTKDRRAARRDGKSTTRDRRAAPREEVPPPQPELVSDGMPPGPRRPAVVQTLEWVFDPETFMRRCARRYGTAFTVCLGPSTSVVFLSDPAQVRAVFQRTSGGWTR